MLARMLPVFVCAALACASRPALRAPDVAPNLRVPEGHTLLFKASAKGAQIYACKAKPDEPLQAEWVLKAPDAELTDDHGAPVGRHYAGPTWEGKDGSKVVGKLRERAPAPRADAVPWLLLEAKETQGQGLFARVAFVQRVDTTGGKAPAGPCDPIAASGDLRVEYTATYFFWGKGP